MPVLLVVVAVVSAFVGLRSPTNGPAPAPLAPTAPLEAPVLTARRAPALLAEPIGERRLADDLAALWAMTPTTSCLSVTDGERLVFERSPAVPLTPASTLKLVTATAALHRLGGEERLRTTVRTAAPPVDGVVEGDLYLVGGGDPVLGTAAWAASSRHQPALVTPLEQLADRVVAAGVREVRGSVVGDDSRYDQERYRPTWPDRYRVNVEIGPLSALSVNDGLAEFGPRRVPFPDPPTGAAEVFRDLLAERGVAVAGAPGAGAAPAGLDLAFVLSPTVDELAASMLSESDNGTAELFVKELGVRLAGEGSTAAGSEVVLEALADLGLPTAGVVLQDGSGLDRGNTATCALLAGLLARADDGGGAVHDGLAVAGSSGTLAGRFLGRPAAGRLRAKTGALNGVAGLAGYAQASTGEDLMFAYLLNGINGLGEAAPLQEQLGDMLVAFPDQPPLDDLGPEGHPRPPR